MLPFRQCTRLFATRGNTDSTYRADRVLANRGWGTRTECTRILRSKRVFIRKIPKNDGDLSNDGQEGPATTDAEFECVLGPSTRIAMDAPLWIDRKKEVPLPPPLIRVYHKPKWMLSVMSDPELQRPNLSSLSFLHNGSMHPVGRLDYDSSGLLLFSSKGTLTQTLLHPSNEIEKEYVALVVGKVTHDALEERLRQGVNTTMGSFQADLVESSHLSPDEVPQTIADIVNNLPPEYDTEKLEKDGRLDFRQAKELSRVRVVVREGKHRMVRRILANSGHPVVGLKRERLGAIRLDDLAAGKYREMTDAEQSWIESIMKRSAGSNKSGSNSGNATAKKKKPADLGRRKNKAAKNADSR